MTVEELKYFLNLDFYPDNAEVSFIINLDSQQNELQYIIAEPRIETNISGTYLDIIFKPKKQDYELNTKNKKSH